ncbi:glycoside hydrolase family 13 protein [Cellulomonas marina]|uniref:Alpha-glucosidase n=1 Tax=Cellulomonas marina TaxID=988821 RepID=A0A1I0VY82_9CELL|nr:glycoside hydrolase family 13 protein [Cellulomonas marina]GIG27505.1 alpha-glycosidase [Cellulomonas marina]SFA80636.1 alpha-glucosidase [Cellulomonas marina]
MSESHPLGHRARPLLQPHHDGSPLYAGTDAPGPGDTVSVRVRVPSVPGADARDARVVLRWVRDGEPVLREAVRDGDDDAGAWFTADLEVSNPVTSYRFVLVEGGRYRVLNAEGLHARDVSDAGDFLASSHAGPPGWVADQVAYQVFPDRFARSGVQRPLPDWALPAGWDDPVVHRGPDTPRQVYGGDLDGVAAHLDHVADLGATLLYLTPVFEGRSNHRYDARTFDRVDPLLGGDEALVRLVQAAHARGIRVVGDLTLNHTGDDHDWFRAAQADAGAPEAGYYTFHEHPHRYASWLGVPSLPKLDHRAPALRRALYEGPGSVVDRWLRAGLDGWRIDVANMTGRLGATDLAHDVARAVRGTMAPDRWLLAEHGHDAAPDLAGDGWHGTMDYAAFTRPVWTWLNGGGPQGPGLPHGLEYLGIPVPVPVLPATAAVATLREVRARAPWRAWTSSTLHLDSHDTPRFRTVAGGGTHGGVDREGHGRARHLVGLALQMTLPGVPSIFAGDELGLTGTDGEHSRTPFPWDRRGTWDDESLDAYRTWVDTRRAHVALRRGGLRFVDVGEDHLTFLREHADGTVLVHAARAPHGPVVLPAAALGVAGAAALEPLTPGTGAAADVGAGLVVLPADGPAAHAWRLP